MNDVNELWSSPWRKLQKNLASGFNIEGSGPNLLIGSAQVANRITPSSSWLVRAHSRKAQVAPRIQ
jgi:hypothetical protein